MWVRCLDAIDRCTAYTVALFMAVMVIDVVLNIFMRYALHTSIVWSEELGMYLMIWSSMLATAIAFRKGSHVAFTIVRNLFPVKIKWCVVILSHAVVASFLVLMIYHGVIFSIVSLHLSTPALRISKTIPYLSIPVGGLLMLLQMSHVVINDLKEFKKIDMGVSHV
jgi:TRAP-type C4-dicarboxylate transport system permease small subunit